MTEWILSSSILILIVIALRTCFNGKISLRLQYAIWGLVLLRLLIPFSFGSTIFSLANLTISNEPPAIQSTIKPDMQNAQYYAGVLAARYEANPATFCFACRQMIPEQDVNNALDMLAIHWNITPAEVREKLQL